LRLIVDLTAVERRREVVQLYFGRFSSLRRRWKGKKPGFFGDGAATAGSFVFCRSADLR
jgi:hypothetical protein